MTHRNVLPHTRPDHPLRQRPMYHAIRQALAERREHATGGLFRAAAPPPDLVDWFTAWPAVRDQGPVGVCYGFQDRNVRMAAHSLAIGAPEPEDLSPRFAAWSGRQLEGSAADANAGCSIGDSLQGMEEAGISTEALCPYSTDSGVDATPPSAEALADALTRRVELQAVQVDFSSHANIHQVLADRHPVIFGFDVPQAFEACPTSGTLPLDPGPGQLGGHAGSFCASKLSDGWLREVNSWGQIWGYGGTCFFTGKWLELIWECWAIVPVS